MVTFYACAGEKLKPDDKNDTKLKPDFSKTFGGKAGVFNSGDRDAMCDASTKYLEAIIKGETPGEVEEEPGVVADIPKVGYTEKGGDSHTLLVEDAGGGAKVFRHSVKKKVSDIHDDADTFTMLALIEKQADVYLGKKKDGRIGAAGDKAILARIDSNLAKLDKLMAKARGDSDPTVKDRLKFEQTLGKGVMKHSKALAASKDMADKAWALMSVSAREGLELTKEVDKTLLLGRRAQGRPHLQEDP